MINHCHKVSRPYSRAGLSLVELLVVLGIFAVLMGLLLSAVQNIRRAALRANAGNGLRQISLAFHSYAANTPVSKLDRNGGGSVFYDIQKYMDLRYGTGFLIPGPIGQPPSQSQLIWNFVNPADPSFHLDDSGQPDIHLGDCSYAINSLLCRTPVKGLDVPDGTSNTIAFAERYTRCGKIQAQWRVNNADCYEGMPAHRVPCRLSQIINRRATFADEAYIDENRPATNGSGGIIPGLTFQAAPHYSECDPRVVQGAFSQGLMVALGDGSVRTISASISENTYWALVTPAGGEVLGDW